MKSSRKIWSLPLVLVTALLLVGLFAASVLAQSAPTGKSSIGAIDAKGAPTISTVSALFENMPWDATGSTINYTVLPLIAANPNATPAVEAVPSPAIVGGPKYDFDGNGTAADVFTIAGDGTGGNADGELSLAVGLNGALAEANVDMALPNDSYTFEVKMVIDRDNDVNSDNLGTALDDRDLTLTATVTVNVMRVKTDELLFDVVPGKAVKGSLVSGLRHPIASNPLEWEVSGIGSSAKLVSVEDNGAVGDFVIKETPAGSGKFRLFVENSEAGALGATQEIDIDLVYDADTAVDSDAVETTAADENTDVTINIEGTITSRNSLAFTGGNVGDPGVPATRGQLPDGEEYHYEFTIASNTAEDTPIGSFGIDGRITIDPDSTPGNADDVVEYLDGIISGDDAAPFEVRDSDMTLTYDGSPALEVGTYELDLTVSGDAGLANRTIIGKVLVTVTASNLAPTAPGTFTGALNENEPSDDVAAADGPPVVEAVPGLVEAETEVGDASVGVDANDGDSLTYSLDDDGDTIFDIDASTGMITVGDDGISDTTGGPTEDDATAVYERGDFGELVDDTDKYSDITYSFDITVSDGISANDKTISATVTVDVNEPPATTADVVEDATTGAKSFSVAKSVEDDARGVSILDLGTLVTDDDGGLTYEISAPAPAAGETQQDLPPELSESNGHVVLLFVPTGLETKSYTFVVEASDGYNPEDGVDETITVTIDVTITRPERGYPTLRIDVDEEFTGDVLDDSGNTVSVSGAIAGATEWDIIGDSGADGSTAADADGTRDFDVDENTGVVSVEQARDADATGAILNPSLTVSASNADGDDLGNITVIFSIQDVNEGPAFIGQPSSGFTPEEGEPNRNVKVSDAIDAVNLMVVATDEDAQDSGAIYSIMETGSPFAISSAGAITVSGELDYDDATMDNPYVITVVATDRRDSSLTDTHSVSISIGDLNDSPVFTEPEGALAELKGANAVDEDHTYADGAILSFAATDADMDDLEFRIREGKSQTLFEIGDVTAEKDSDGNNTGKYTGKLFVKRGLNADGSYNENATPLDYEASDYDTQTGHLVNIDVIDGRGGDELLRVDVYLNNVNDNNPAFNATNPATTLTVVENTARGHVLSNYAASDADGQYVVYSLEGANADSFRIDSSGNLMTLESLDADLDIPCGSGGCVVDVVATDVMKESVIERGTSQREVSETVRITIINDEDSISTPHITKANPVPGTEQGVPGSALAGTKTGGYEFLWNELDCPAMLEHVGEDPAEANSDPASAAKTAYCKMYDGLTDSASKKVRDAFVSTRAPAESPYDLPATYGSAPKNFVETEWANWGTVLRIEVTAESPDAGCGVNVAGNNNQCVEILVESDSAGDTIKVAAYRSNAQDNRYVAAVMLVELEGHASNYALDSDGDEIRTAIYKHQRVRNIDNSPSTKASDPVLQVPRLQVDEEDEIEIEFGNLRTDIEVENEPPEISNFAPAHEDAFDDADVDYTFTVTDDNSGLSEPEDLPDNDGDADYTPVVGLVSDTQCSITERESRGIIANLIHIHENAWLDCGDNAQDGEYKASEPGYGFAPIRDDKDFDSTTDGYDVETTLVLVKNKIFYVTYIACDLAGNCTSYDPDGNDRDVELAQITVDTELPEFVEARTGVKWDSNDNEYDDDRRFIQVLFDDLTPLNSETVEADDFVVEGHNVTAVYVYSPDEDETRWGDENSDGSLNLDTEPTRYANGGPNSSWGTRDPLYRMLDRTVFLELEDELLADETPDVTIVPNGVEDQAGNEQDDGDVEAKDWIAPRFTIVSIVAPDTPEGATNQLAGEDDEVTVMVTSDERLDQTRPDVTVTYVDASMIDTKGVAECGTDDNKRKRGEITRNTARATSDKCADNDLATGEDLNNHIEKITNTEWMVTVTKPKATGYYNFHIEGEDRSPKKNRGSEGVSPDSIVTEFFDSDGDVNTDDAWFWEADINLPNPNIRVSGEPVTDNEASVEYRSPLFVEIDFANNHWDAVDCGRVTSDERRAYCMNENSEYSEDTFDDVVVTMFELDGVDMTDSVKTTDDQTFLVSLENVSLGDHTVMIQAMDQAGNVLEDVLEIDFEVNDRDPFERRLNPGWNLVSLPGEPSDSAIGSVFGPGVEVRTVYTYDPVVPGGWMVAVRETLDSDWQGDLTEVNGSRGYWVLSDAIQDWAVSVPRLAGGAAGTGTPIQPPVIALYAGWNLIPITDISGNGEGGQTVSADVYLQNLDDGLDLARVLGFNTISNQWVTVLDPDMQMNNQLRIGDAYWIFVREAASLVPSGYVGGGGGD